MAVDQASDSVTEFYGRLRRLLRECRVSQADLSRALNRSQGTISELLRGHRATPPHWEDIRAIVQYCRSRAPETRIDVDWWRHQHTELEEALESARRAPATERVDAVPEDFAEAVAVLAAGRPGLRNLASDILRPLELAGAPSTDLRRLFAGFAERVRRAAGTTRTALLCAADRVVLVAAFCEAVAETGLTRNISHGNTTHDVAAAVLAEFDWLVLGSSHVRETTELRNEIAAAYQSAAEMVHSQVELQSLSSERLGALALRRYSTVLGGLTFQCAELRITSETFEGTSEDDLTAMVPEVGLTRFGSLLSEFAGGGHLSAGARNRLRGPVSHAGGSGLVMPSRVAGYVEPTFRVAAHAVERKLSSDSWWDRQPIRDDLSGFLAAYLLTDRATQGPLIVLGHPGSGKSLLTQLLTAWLPESEFLCVRVELRHVPADLDLQGQIEEAIRQTTGRQTSWPDLSETDKDLLRVVILDGFDELLQAAAGSSSADSHWSYLREIVHFQQREAELGRPTTFVVTSRTVVADRVDTPSVSTVIRLEPFDNDRVDRWLTVWADVNRRYFEISGLVPLNTEAVRRHQDLARQPLLLLLLALYDATHNDLHELSQDDIDRGELYERLLTEFVGREVVKSAGPLPAAQESVLVEQELRRLGVIAAGMFNRGQQSILSTAARIDLKALTGEDRADSIFGRFFFVHEARAEVARVEMKSYEFLHATFGEYLVARQIVAELSDLLTAARPTDRDRLPDHRLCALLSHVPLTDRAEVAQNTADLLASGRAGPQEKVTPLLRLLFRQIGESESDLSSMYAPTARPRSGRDAIYQANILFLAVLTTGSVRLREFTEQPWWRLSFLWRSQFDATSWDSFTTTLSVRQTLDGEADTLLRLGLPSSKRPPEGPSADGRGPGTYYVSQIAQASDIIRRTDFLDDDDTQALLHAIMPLLDGAPETLRTIRVDAVHGAKSAAHTLLTLLLHDTAHAEQLSQRYRDIAAALPYLPDTQANRISCSLIPHLARDASHLSGELVVRLLNNLTDDRFPADKLDEEHRLSLLTCVRSQFGRSGVPHPRLAAVARRLLLATDLSLERPEGNTWGGLRAVLSLTEAISPNLLGSRFSGEQILTTGAALLHRSNTTADRPPADVVVGLVRLAIELSRDDWLVLHAETLLLQLQVEEFCLLRPSDVKVLWRTVRNQVVVSSLLAAEHAWTRGPGG
ncbi:NACHT domain-containing protein [Kitasatospora sp. NPDC004289]